jgi:autotransporter-associated beta strand protein
MNGSITLDGNANYKIDVYHQPSHWKFNGGITRSGSNTGTLTLNLTHWQQATPVRLTINSTIDNNGGPVTLLGDTAGVLQMDAAGHDLGDFTINGESTATSQTILKLGINDALATDKNLTLTKGSFDLGGFHQTVNALSGVASVSWITNTGSADSTLTVGNGNGSATFSGVIQDGATNKLGLEKIGSGTQVLSGTLSYSGDTTVKGGTLTLKQINTSNESSTVTIAAGAKLGLDFAGSDTVDKLFLGTPAVQISPGTYSASHPTYGSYFENDGSLIVTNGPAPAAGFSSWIGGTFAKGTVDAGQRGANDDPDGDGISNLLEYAVLDQDPTVPNPSVGILSGKTLRFSKRADVSGLTYTIEKSSDLGIFDPWTAVTPTVNDASTISYTLPDGSAQNFQRLKITQE